MKIEVTVIARAGGKEIERKASGELPDGLYTWPVEERREAIGTMGMALFESIESVWAADDE